MDGFNPEDRVTVNKIYSGGNRILANTAARNPKVEFLPRSEGATEAFFRGQELINYDIEELNMVRDLNLALEDHLAAPFGAVRHGFSPSEELLDDDGNRIDTFRNHRADKPWIKRVKIWDLLFDCTKSGFHTDDGIDWVAFRDIQTLSQIERNPNMASPEGITGNIGVDEKLTKIRRKMLEMENQDIQDSVEFYTVYDLNERKWFQMTLDGLETPLRQPADWPIQWEHLPVDIFFVNPQMDSPFPMAMLQQAIPLQQELDRAYTILKIVARNTRRLLIVEHEGLDPEEIEKLEDSAVVEIIMSQGPPDRVLKEFKSGGFPQELLLWVQLLETELREALGDSAMDRAQRINVESATEASQVQRGSDTLSSRTQNAYGTFVTETLKNYIHARRETMLEDELVPILGPEGAIEARSFLSVSPEDLQQDYDFKMVAGSTIPDSHSREAEKAFADLNVAQSMPEIHNLRFLAGRYWEKRGIPPSKAMSEGQTTPSEVPGEPKDQSLDPQVLSAIGGRGQ